METSIFFSIYCKTNLDKVRHKHLLNLSKTCARKIESVSLQKHSLLYFILNSKKMKENYILPYGNTALYR